MAVVYSATRKGSSSVVALKRPLPYPGINADRRLAREIRALTAVDHPNVMRVLDHGVDAGEHWYTMPKADYSLSDYWESASIVTAEALCSEVLDDICAGLGAMHEARYVHRDVTPKNIFAFREPARPSGYRWVIGDCGLARPDLGETTTELTGSVSRLGTNGYMAPESFGAPHEVPYAADVYSLGRVLARLLTNQRPELTKDLLPAGPWRPVVRAFTKAEPSQRPQTMPAALSKAKELLMQLPASAKLDYRARVKAVGGTFAADDPIWDVVEEHLDDEGFMIDDLILVNTGTAKALAAARPDFALNIAEHLGGHLMAGSWTTGRSFDQAIVHLNWLKAVLEGLLKARRLDLFGDLAPEYCRAVERWDRYPHLNLLRPWLGTLSGDAAVAMARAIHQSGATKYFAREMSGRRVSNSTLAALLEG
jgi:hypothetical protein